MIPLRKVSPDVRPSHADLAMMSQHVYEGVKLKLGDVPTKDNPSWELYDFCSDLEYKSGFFAALYLDTVKKQMVLSFQGTDPSCLGDLWEDFFGVVRSGRDSPQKRCAEDYVQKVLKFAIDEGARLTFTGHSLGGYLAEYSLYYVKLEHQSWIDHEHDPAKKESIRYLADNISAVTFESPGLKDFVDFNNSLKAVGKAIPVEELDVIGYLTYPTLINTCNRQVGTYYSLSIEIELNPGSYMGWFEENFDTITPFSIHAMDNIVRAFKNADQKCPQRFYMEEWPVLTRADQFYKHVIFNRSKKKYVWSGGLTIKTLKGEFIKAIRRDVGFKYDQGLSLWSSLPLRNVAPQFRELLVNFFNRYNALSVEKQEQLLALMEKLKVAHTVTNFFRYCKLQGRRRDAPPTTGYLKVSEMGSSVYAVIEELSTWFSETENEKFINQVFETATSQDSVELVETLVPDISEVLKKLHYGEVSPVSKGQHESPEKDVIVLNALNETSTALDDEIRTNFLDSSKRVCLLLGQGGAGKSTYLKKLHDRLWHEALKKIGPKDEGVHQAASNTEFFGLKFEAIPMDGHCLFQAIGLYLGQDAAFLRQLVAAHMEENLEVFKVFRPGSDDDFRAYIEAIRNTNEWGGNIEIQIIQKVTDRPIIIIRPDANPIIPDDLQRYKGDPIFVYYNGHTHYDAFMLKDDKCPSEVLANIQFQLQQGQRVVYNPVTEFNEDSQKDLSQLKIPVMISMNSYDAFNAENCVYTHLMRSSRRVPLTEIEVSVLKRSPCQFIFIFDGLDELARGGGSIPRLYSQNHLENWGIQTQAIVSCRSECLLGQPYKTLLSPENNVSALIELTIAPLEQEQIKYYLQCYVDAREKRGAEFKYSAGEYLQSLQQSKHLKKIVTTPFMLSTFVEIYPKLRSGNASRAGEDKRRKNTTAHEILEKFVNAWIDRQKGKLLTTLTMKGTNDLFSHFESNVKAYSMRLALAIFQEAKLGDSEPSRKKTLSELNRHFFRSKDENPYFVKASPLKNQGDTYQFIHESIRDYFVSEMLWGALENFYPDDDVSAANLLQIWGRNYLTKGIGEFNIIDIISERIRMLPYQARTKYVEALYFLISLTKTSYRHYYYYEKKLYRLIADSEEFWAEHAKTEVAASNAISILNFSLIPFTIKAAQTPNFFSWISVSHAWLQCAELSGVTLTSSNLSRCHLDGAKLSGTDFYCVNLEGVFLGQYPTLSMEREVAGIDTTIFAGQHDNVRLAVPQYSKIKIYNKRKDGLIWEEEDIRLELEWNLEVTDNHILKVGFSNSGRKIAATDDKGNIHVWELTNNPNPGEAFPIEVKTYRASADTINSFLFVNDNQLLTVGSDRTIRLWDLFGPVSPPIQSSTVPNNIQYCAITTTRRDEDVLVLLACDDIMHLLAKNIIGGEAVPTNEIVGHQGMVTVCCFFDGDRKIVSGDVTGVIKIWQVDGMSCYPFSELLGHTIHKAITDIQFSYQNRHVVSSSEDRTIRIWRLDGTLVKTLTGHTEIVTSIRLIRDNQQLISSGLDKTIRTWEFSDIQYPPIIGHSAEVTYVAFSVDQQYVLSCGNDGTVCLWDQDGLCDDRVYFENVSNMIASLSKNKEFMAVAYTEHDDNILHLFSQDRRDHIIFRPNSEITCLDFSPDLRELIAGDVEGNVLSWPVNFHRDNHGSGGTCLYPHSDAMRSSVRKVTYSQDGKYIFSVNSNGLNRFNNLLKSPSDKDNRKLYEIDLPAGSEIKTVDISSDGWAISIVSNSHPREQIHVYGFETPQRSGNSHFVILMLDEDKKITSIALSPKNKFVAASIGSLIQLWSIYGGRITHLYQCQGHDDIIRSVKFSPSGEQLVSGANDNTIRVWQKKTASGDRWCQFWQAPRNHKLMLDKDTSFKKVKCFSDGNRSVFKEVSAQPPISCKLVS